MTRIVKFFQEYGYNILATILYFTGFVVQFAIWSPRTAHQFQGSNIAAGVYNLTIVLWVYKVIVLYNLISIHSASPCLTLWCTP